MGNPLHDGYNPFGGSAPMSSQDSMGIFNIVAGGAFLTGVGGVSLVGGILVGIGVLAAKGVINAAKFFAGDAQKKLKSEEQPALDMDQWFDRLSVEKNGFSSTLNQADAKKVIDLLSNRREEGIDYSNFSLSIGGKPILETNEAGEITNNQFASPLSDSRIVKILQAAVRNMKEGIPVGSQAVVRSCYQIPDEQIKTLAEKVAQIIQAEAAERSNPEIATQLESDLDKPMSLNELEMDEIAELMNESRDFDQLPEISEVPDVEEITVEQGGVSSAQSTVVPGVSMQKNNPTIQPGQNNSLG